MFKKIFFVSILCLILSTFHAYSTEKFSCDETWEQILKEYEIDPLYESLIGLCGDNFKNKLWGKISTNKYLSYKVARTIMFSKLDNVDGFVCGAYSGTCIETESIPDAKYYNTEHSWCQSWGAVGIAKSDLHHLYPVRSKINSRRNNFPFCEVNTVYWEKYGSAFGRSFSDTSCFEPRDEHKGALARAMFYFSVRYSRPIDPEQENFFRKWSGHFSVSDKEYYRNEAIFKHQGNRNPFVEYPEFARLIRDF